MIIIYFLTYQKSRRNHGYNNEDWLPNPQIIRTTIEKVLRAFENVIQMELMRVRWGEIKKLQSKPALVATTPIELYNLPK